MLPVGLQGADRYDPAPLPRSHNPGERSHVQTRRQRERLQSKFCHTETSQLTINNTYTTSTMTVYYCLFLILSRGYGRYFLLCYLHCNTCVRQVLQLHYNKLCKLHLLAPLTYYIISNVPIEYWLPPKYYHLQLLLVLVLFVLLSYC